MDLDYLTTFSKSQSKAASRALAKNCFAPSRPSALRFANSKRNTARSSSNRVGKSMELTAAFVSMVRHGFGGDSDHGHNGHSAHTTKKHKATK